MADTIQDTVQEETQQVQDIANHNLDQVVAKCWNELARVPLHTHLAAMKTLDAKTEHRFTTMKLEAEDRQRKAQSEFEKQRRQEHEKMKEQQLTGTMAAKPTLVTQ